MTTHISADWVNMHAKIKALNDAITLLMKYQLYRVKRSRYPYLSKYSIFLIIEIKVIIHFTVLLKY